MNPRLGRRRRETGRSPRPPRPPPPSPASPARPVSPASPAAPASPAPTASDRRSTPTARNVAKEHDVNLARVQGSGAAGRVRKQDVEKAIAPRQPRPTSPPASPARGGTERLEERQRMSKRRATIA